MHNSALRAKLVFYGVTHKKVAEEMGINARVFRNKLHHYKVNGYEARFTERQKEWIAERFSLDINEIE